MEPNESLQLVNSILENLNILIQNDNFSQVTNILWGLLILAFICSIIVKLATMWKESKEGKDVPYKAYKDMIDNVK